MQTFRKCLLIVMKLNCWPVLAAGFTELNDSCGLSNLNDLVWPVNAKLVLNYSCWLLNEIEWVKINGFLLKFASENLDSNKIKKLTLLCVFSFIFTGHTGGCHLQRDPLISNKMCVCKKSSLLCIQGITDTKNIKIFLLWYFPLLVEVWWPSG